MLTCSIGYIFVSLRAKSKPPSYFSFTSIGYYISLFAPYVRGVGYIYIYIRVSKGASFVGILTSSLTLRYKGISDKTIQYKTHQIGMRMYTHFFHSNLIVTAFNYIFMTSFVGLSN